MAKLYFWKREIVKQGFNIYLNIQKNLLMKGIELDEIPDAVIAAITQGKIVGYQGRKKTRAIYEVNFNGKTQYIAITVSNNGYIVGANPRTTP